MPSPPCCRHVPADTAEARHDRDAPRPSHRDALFLARGLRIDLPVRAGTELSVLEGEAELTETPRWVGETALRLRVRLVPGRVHAVAGTGSLSVQALRATRLLVQDPAAQSRQHPGRDARQRDATPRPDLPTAAPGWATAPSRP